MVKKLQKTAEPATPVPSGLLDSQLAQTIKDSAHQIWLAGLGAFAKAQGGGNKVFDTLMKEGVSLQRKTQAAAEEKLGDAAGKVAAMAGEVGHKANAQWDKLETIFEERTARALAKLGVPSAKMLADLGARLDALATAVTRLQGAGAPAAKPRFKPGKAMADKATSGAAPAAAKPAARKRVVKVAVAPAAAPAAPAPTVAVKRRTVKAATAETAALPKPVKAPRKRAAAKP
jgi:poly(hydroxyalkanoate) granule-associated protein